jgi:hypothetical protein
MVTDSCDAQVFHAPHIAGMSSVLSTRFTPIRYRLHNGSLVTNVRFSNPLLGSGWLSASGEGTHGCRQGSPICPQHISVSEQERVAGTAATCSFHLVCLHLAGFGWSVTVEAELVASCVVIDHFVPAGKCYGALSGSVGTSIPPGGCCGDRCMCTACAAGTMWARTPDTLELQFTRFWLDLGSDTLRADAPPSNSASGWGAAQGPAVGCGG